MFDRNDSDCFGNAIQNKFIEEHVFSAEALINIREAKGGCGFRNFQLVTLKSVLIREFMARRKCFVSCDVGHGMLVSPATQVS